MYILYSYLKGLENRAKLNKQSSARYHNSKIRGYIIKGLIIKDQEGIYVERG